LSIQQASLLFSKPTQSGRRFSFFPFGAAFLGTGRFVFAVRFSGATDFVFRFDFAPLAGFGRATGLPFVFVAFVTRLFGRDAESDFGCVALANRS
jgi:hypothetical protein